MLVLIGLAGALGAVCRYGADALVARMHRWSLPIGTFVINVSGSFLLGWVHSAASDVWAAVVGTGFCGGFTTFSTASVEVVRLALRPWHAVGYATLTAVTCVGAVALGGLLAS